MVVVSRRVLRARRVTADELCGALSIYVMIGIIWGSVPGLLEIRSCTCSASAAKR
ncbi:MAG: hypothetical protein U1E76_07490 [Planctomycetota bacterium]